MNNSECKLRGKKAIQGNIFISFLVIATLVVIRGIPSAMARSGRPVLMSFAGIISLAVFILAIPMEIGMRLYFVRLTETGSADYNNLFAPYKNGSMEEAIKAKLLIALYILLGTLALIIPGIYMMLKYSMIDYIFAENPKISYKDAMKEAADIMKGNKGRLIAFFFSFILWWIACVFVFPIVYVAPYYEASRVQFYYSVKKVDIISPESPYGDAAR